MEMSGVAAGAGLLTEANLAVIGRISELLDQWQLSESRRDWTEVHAVNLVAFHGQRQTNLEHPQAKPAKRTNVTGRHDGDVAVRTGRMRADCEAARGATRYRTDCSRAAGRGV